MFQFRRARTRVCTDTDLLRARSGKIFDEFAGEQIIWIRACAGKRCGRRGHGRTVGRNIWKTGRRYGWRARWWGWARSRCGRDESQIFGHSERELQEHV